MTNLETHFEKYVFDVVSSHEDRISSPLMKVHKLLVQERICFRGYMCVFSRLRHWPLSRMFSLLQR